MWTGKTVVVGVTGSIAAYKACDLVSRLAQSGARVHVIMTESATHLVAPATFRELSREPVTLGLWDQEDWRPTAHISLAEAADLVLVAPASANVLGKVAAGIADDFLSTFIMATKAPVIFAPAMNENMWLNPVVQANTARLVSLGYHFVMPAHGHLACGVEGVGRFAGVDAVLAAGAAALRPGDLTGVRVLITAGATREALDPVRFISNRSSGRMGYALAVAARDRGAEVTLISGPVALPAPVGVRLVRVESALEMLTAAQAEAPAAKLIILAAAVGDYRVAEPADRKVKRSKEKLTLELIANPDVAAALAEQRRPGQTLVGFAAETEDLVANACGKLSRKGLDFIVANLVGPGRGFETETNAVTVVGREGVVADLPETPKGELAHRILETVTASGVKP